MLSALAYKACAISENTNSATTPSAIIPGPTQWYANIRCCTVNTAAGSSVPSTGRREAISPKENPR